MTQYNLNRNGSFTTVTGTGYGNVQLSWSQLEKLIDGNTSSSGISLTGSDVLYIETDLSNRIKIDGINLYTSNGSISGNVYFFYRNTPNSSYAQLTTNVDGTKYYTSIPSPSAPRYLVTVISGASCDIYEYEIFNEDYTVAFGDDGQLYAKYIENSAVGEEGPATSVPIYNNGTGSAPVNAYVCIDWTENEADYYIEIAEATDGTWYGIDSGVILENSDTNNSYTWGMGRFSNTSLINDKLSLGLSGNVRLGDIPKVTTDTDNFNVGWSNPWDYDEVNNKVYAISSDSSVLKLFEYDVATNVWTYVGEINPGCTDHADKASMCYCDGYVYVLCSHTTKVFGRYDLSGAQDNWQTLSTPGYGGTPHRIGLCSNYTNKVYLIHHQYGTTANRYFGEYNIGTNTWSQLDSTYENNSSNTAYYRAQLSYDKERDWVYANVGDYGAGDIQRFVLASGVWSTQYIDVSSITGKSNNYDLTMDYYNNYLLFGGSIDDTASLRDKIYYYNVATAEQGYFDLNTAFYYNNSYASHIIGISGTGDLAVLYVNVLNDTDALYGYNYNLATATGTYTTPIFGMSDKYESSYFVVDVDTNSNFNSVSYDTFTYNGTIRVRSTSEAPVTSNEVFIFYSTDGNSNNISRMDINNGDFDYTIVDDFANSYYRPTATAVCRRTGRIACAGWYDNSLTGHDNSFIRIFDEDFNEIYYLFSSGEDYMSDVNLEFDAMSGLWGYSTEDHTLFHYDSSLEAELFHYEPGFAFCTNFSVEVDGEGVWYIDSTSNSLMHIDSVGAVLGSKTMSNPTCLAAGNDGVCWVFDSTNKTFYKYNASAVLLTQMTVDHTATLMASDYEDGFWYFSAGYLYHVNSSKVVTTAVEVGSSVSNIKPGYNGCATYSDSNYIIKWVGLGGSSVSREFDTTLLSSSTYKGFPSVMTINYKYFREFNMDGDLYPRTDDPVWGAGGSLQWKEVSKDGYFLPKTDYHQVELTLRAFGGGSPIVNKVIMSPAIKVEDIPSQSSRDIYIRSNIPSSGNVEDYETKLKCWWGVRDV